MGWLFGNNEETEERDWYNSRSHQDNFRGDDNYDNGSYQYCSFCGGNRRFIFDRCEECKNN